MSEVKRELRSGDIVRVVNPLSSCHGKTGIVEHIGEAEQLGWVGVRIPESNFHVMQVTSVERIPKAEQSALSSALSGDELVNVLTRALRTGDRAYESVGGSTRHYVRECLLPVLERMRLAVVAIPPPPKAEGKP